MHQILTICIHVNYQYKSSETIFPYTNQKTLLRKCELKPMLVEDLIYPKSRLY